MFPKLFHKFRSHSTGNSLVQPRENLDRFTLRLHEDMRKQVVKPPLLNRAGSTVRMVGEVAERKGTGPPERLATGESLTNGWRA
ncbi:hypothetical protein SSX86_030113 [Deinandra increscens subsp. villosa]|uniref:Uncharacterized protein n=1 Tax=Deinandra increscens subsp. villosa TaxID=3103831 RepID=A0AAP0CAW0_9ASTR